MPAAEQPNQDLSRYSRQVRYPPLGEAGQLRLAKSGVLVCGCGALGSALANTLVRAGVGRVRIVDRDFVDLSNLQRQSLFDEQDAANGIPKAVAAAEKLARINSQVQIEPVVADVTAANIRALCADMETIVDGTDNFETRFLLNDISIESGLPWVYGGCLGAEGQTMTIVPGETACLRCLMPECPPPGSSPTCDTAGILGPIVSLIAAIQAAEAIKLLAGQRRAISRNLVVVDLWENRLRQIDMTTLAHQQNCPTCNERDFPWLEGRCGSRTAVLCGRNAVQLAFPSQSPMPLSALADKLSGLGQLTQNQYLLRLKTPSHELTLFADGRAIVSGTDDIAIARALYARYVGN